MGPGVNVVTQFRASELRHDERLLLILSLTASTSRSLNIHSLSPEHYPRSYILAQYLPAARKLPDLLRINRVCATKARSTTNRNMQTLQCMLISFKGGSCSLRGWSSCEEKG